MISASASRPLFKHQMLWTTRAWLILLGVVILVVCAIALFFLGVLFWSLFTA